MPIAPPRVSAATSLIDVCRGGNQICTNSISALNNTKAISNEPITTVRLDRTDDVRSTDSQPIETKPSGINSNTLASQSERLETATVCVKARLNRPHATSNGTG